MDQVGPPPDQTFRACLHPALDRAAPPRRAEEAARTRILTWAAGYTTDPNWFIQKSVAWWLRELSKRDPDTVQAFLARHGPAMKPFARKDAARHLPPSPSLFCKYP